ncbi:MAG: hypothetical protein HY465_00795 [Deltaproteobacteria bacterium]|nr:hypothetical protein [Deltaproteobacteria bacterium]
MSNIGQKPSPYNKVAHPSTSVGKTIGERKMFENQSVPQQSRTTSPTQNRYAQQIKEKDVHAAQEFKSPEDVFQVKRTPRFAGSPAMKHPVHHGLEEGYLRAKEVEVGGITDFSRLTFLDKVIDMNATGRKLQQAAIASAKKRIS